MHKKKNEITLLKLQNVISLQECGRYLY